jgi:hypothetical protein
MKLNQLLAACGVAAALFMGAGNVSAQNNNDGNGGGPGGGGGGFGGGGNFDPAAFQQRMMDNVKDQLGFTNDTDWAAVEPLVQKVMDARRDAGGAGGFGRMFGGGGRRGGGGPGGPGGGGRGGRGGFGGAPNPDAEALQKAIDDNAPTGQINDALEKYRASQKDKQAKLLAAQEDLKKVLQPGKQEAAAVLLGFVN